MHFEDDSEELTGWILGAIFGLLGIGLMVGVPAWICSRAGQLTIWGFVAFSGPGAFCLYLARIFLVTQVSVDLQSSPRMANVVWLNLITRCRRKRSYPIPDDAAVILEQSDGVYSVRIRRRPFRWIFLPTPSDGGEASILAANVGRFLGIEVESGT
jgi:hypothetical protein